MPNHETRTCTVLSTTGHIIRLSSAITGTRHWKKITPEQMHIYYSFLPGAAAAQSLSLHMHPASCHAHPAHSLCPLLPFSLSPPNATFCCAVSLTPPFTPSSLFHLFAYWGWKSICFIHATFCRTLISSASSLSRPSLHCACLQPVLTIHEFDIFFFYTDTRQGFGFALN